MLSPGEATTFRVVIRGVYDAIPNPDTATLHYALNAGDWFDEPLPPTPQADEYEATLPAASCFDVYQWYVSAEDQAGREFTNPTEAPTVSYSALVATGEEILFVDEFETDRGWDVYEGAETGNWERADPEEVIYFDVMTQPGDDHTPDGTLCYVTGPVAGGDAGDYDVDGGPTILTSPLIDLSGVDPTVSYWRWYHISTARDDELLIDVSSDGGANWINVESIEDRETWTYVEWKVSDYVTPTDQVQVRFTAEDSELPSLVEALIDDFKVTVPVCWTCFADLDGDNDVDLADMSILLDNYGKTGGARYQEGDLDLDGDVDSADLSALLRVYGTTCE